MALWDFLAEKLRASQEAKALYDCKHKRTMLVYIVQSNGVTQYKRQCLDCYQDASLFLSPKKLSKYEKANAAPRDDASKSIHRESFYAERRKMQRAAFWKLYQEYLASPEWAAKHAATLKRDNYTCQLHKRGCTRRATQAHHLTYEHVGNEPLDDLISVCEHCHDIVTAENRKHAPQFS